MAEHMGTQPLYDVKVLDLTHGISGPYCTKLLADFGADVIKVERPGSGDFARSLGPFPQDIPHLEKSGLFLHLNTNKRSIILDLKTAQGVEVLKQLVEGTDILVESFRPGVMAQLGLSYETLREINPNLVMTSVSNFGQTGPYRDYRASELTLYAMGGRMHATGMEERYPLMLGGKHVQYQAGNVAAMASLFAWYGLKYQGLGGQEVDVSILETQMASINSRMAGLLNYQYTGERGRRQGTIRMGYPSGYYPCQDGYVSLLGGHIRWPDTVAMLGMPELLHDPRFSYPHGQMSIEGMEEFEATIWLPWLMERSMQQVVEESQAHQLLSAMVNTIDEVVDNNPQLDSREYFVEIDHPVAGKFRYPGAPGLTEERWWQIRRPAPLLGQHTQEIMENRWGSSGNDMDHPEGETGTQVAQKTPLTPPIPPNQTRKGKIRLPLEGVRVIDMTVVWAGPYGTMFLADMGAEVIRVESLNVFPYSTRGMSARPLKEISDQEPWSYPDREPGSRPWNRHIVFNCHARNKYAMTADLTTPEGKGIFRRLVEKSDVFIENNGLGSMDRLGLTYPVISQWNPRLSMISATGLGQTGPWSNFRGIGSQFEAIYGHASIIGYPDMDAEGIPTTVASDAVTGVTIALATVMALHQRAKTGKGVYIDMSLGEAILPHFGELFMDYIINKRVARSLGNRDYLLVQGAYPCTGDDEWVAISIGTIEEWHILCRLMGRPELVKDKRFGDMQDLHTHHDEVDQIIETWTVDQDATSLFHRLQHEGITAGPLLNEPLAYADPHLKERNFFVPITAPEAGTYLYPSTAFKMSKAPFQVRKPPIRLGEDNDYIYRDVLGLSEEEYDHMKALGQIGMDYAPHIQ